jgi:hypothetical protein
MYANYLVSIHQHSTELNARPVCKVRLAHLLSLKSRGSLFARILRRAPIWSVDNARQQTTIIIIECFVAKARNRMACQHFAGGNPDAAGKGRQKEYCLCVPRAREEPSRRPRSG